MTGSVGMTPTSADLISRVRAQGGRAPAAGRSATGGRVLDISFKATRSVRQKTLGYQEASIVDRGRCLAKSEMANRQLECCRLAELVAQHAGPNNGDDHHRKRRNQYAGETADRV